MGAEVTAAAVDPPSVIQAAKNGDKEALRALKRHVSNAVYRQLVADARRTRS